MTGPLDWFHTPPGQYALAWEQAQFDAALADVFGYHAVQLGMPALNALAANRMPHHWYADVGHGAASAQGAPPPADAQAAPRTVSSRAAPADGAKPGAPASTKIDEAIMAFAQRPGDQVSQPAPGTIASGA